MREEKDIKMQAPEVSAPAPSRQGYGLTVCLVWNRLLIHRKTIRALGDPSRVRLLINPETRRFCVQGCDEKEACSFAVPREMAPVYDPFYIHSKFLLGRIYAMMDWDPGHSYRVFGKYDAGTQVMDFDLNRFVRVHGDERLENDDLPDEFDQAEAPAPLASRDTQALTGQVILPEPEEGPETVMPALTPPPPKTRFMGSLFDSVRLPRPKEDSHD